LFICNTHHLPEEQANEFLAYFVRRVLGPKKIIGVPSDLTPCPALFYPSREFIDGAKKN
jgi:hypothetical protein